MATLAAPATGPDRNERPRGSLARLAPFVPLAVVALVSFVELALADRKYGVFTGGFGQSRAVDAPGEIALFLAGYVAAQALVALAGWALSCRLARGRPGWVALFVFALINGALFCALLAAQYRLHSYFSDAVGFALLRQLGGGSMVDAIKFGLSEIGVSLIALAGAGLVAWLVWRMLRRALPADLAPARGPCRRHWLLAVPLLLVIALAVPRTGSDAAFGLNRTIAWQALGGVLDRLTDFDRDGYGLFGVQYDAAPFDSARHPLALDIPGNGIDEDGYGGDLQLVPLPAPLPAQVPQGT